MIIDHWIHFFFWCEAVLLFGLTCFGLHRLWLMVLFARYRNHRPEPREFWQKLPPVTIQLPVYNETFVIGRLLESVSRLDYPAGQLQIQVLDDSTDQTTQMIVGKAAELQQQGINITVLHRNSRQEFKAGALAEALPHATGDFLVILDADFVPAPDFLKKTIHYFTDPAVGMVQTRWEHLNREHSYLTRAQALWLDAHFRVEQTARSRAGYCFNFNGSAGIWRRQTILSAGGWQGDTLTEDLDLSYRAQLAGWKGIYLDDVVVPAELPMDMNGLKSQQHRWTKGSIETAMKLLPAILKSRLAWYQKLEACFHLGNWFHFLLAVLLILLTFPSMVMHQSLIYQQDYVLLAKIVAMESSLGMFLILSMVLFYSISQRNQWVWWKIVRDIPWLMAISIGLSINNSRAILEAVCGRRSPFSRTPKFALTSSSAVKTKSLCRLPAQSLCWSEIAVGLYVTSVIIYALGQQLYGIIPFLIPPGVGFFYTGIKSAFPKLYP
ncbi:MAG: glycosyltransferase [Candidatus Omnitrophica bacterium]|nr:glycosyltransferase [Candidatus Omnitrophota bacterium]